MATRYIIFHEKELYCSCRLQMPRPTPKDGALSARVGQTLTQPVRALDCRSCGTSYPLLKQIRM